MEFEDSYQRIKDTLDTLQLSSNLRLPAPQPPPFLLQQTSSPPPINNARIARGLTHTPFTYAFDSDTARHNTLADVTNLPRVG